jgi:hypothetical protein
MKNVLFEASDYGYEEGWSLEIYELNNKLYLYESSSGGGYSGEGTEEISQNEALKLMVENEEYEDDWYLDDLHSCAWLGRAV